MVQQLTLCIQLRPSASFESFVGGENSLVIASLRDSQDAFIYLWGESGTGKSHLLQAACHRAERQERSSAYIPLGGQVKLQPEMLVGMESLSLVCIDDLQLLAGDQVWEQALFNLFNQLRESGGQLLIAANQPPASLPIKLNDLSSRLSWGACYQLVPLHDEQRLQLLQTMAQQRGLELNSETASYILQRCARDMHSLSQLMEKLDQASLSAKRRVTIPFVKQVLKL